MTQTPLIKKLPRTIAIPNMDVAIRQVIGIRISLLDVWPYNQDVKEVLESKETFKDDEQLL